MIMAQELEVDGDLKVTGNLQVGTIDSLEHEIVNLKLFIAQLQEQLASMQILPGGVSEFNSNTTWVVPENISKIYTEIWGAGGQGGGAAQYSCSCSGGGGGAGGYVRAVVPVIPGSTLNFIFTDDSENRTGIKIQDGDFLAYATIGGNGDHGSGSSGCGGGSGGSGVIMQGIGLVRIGNGGGGCGCSHWTNGGGSGGQPLQGSIIPSGSSGGSGADCGSGSPSGYYGSNGYIYLMW